MQASANEPIRSFENAESATNYGVEIELRKSLGFISSALNNFSFVGNGSFIYSKIKLKETGFQQSERALQGQAPYVFNLGLYFDDMNMGLNGSIVYNKVGQRIDKVGSADLGNILENPVDLIDLSLSKNIINNFSIKLTIRDLLNQERTFIQQSPIGDKVSEVQKVGRTIAFGISYKL